MATGCEILLHVVSYSARSRYISLEKWIGSEFACFVRISIALFECYFKQFLCLLDVKKPKNFWRLRPLSSHQGPAMDPLGGLQHPQTSSCFLRYASFMLIQFGRLRHYQCWHFFFCINPWCRKVFLLWLCRWQFQVISFF